MNDKNVTCDWLQNKNIIFPSNNEMNPGIISVKIMKKVFAGYYFRIDIRNTAMLICAE